ncbi:MAG: hypothetical protein WCW17_00760 [Patescibacteria group bacterium]
MNELSRLLFGEPIVKGRIKEIVSPAGQYHLCRDIWGNGYDQSYVASQLRDEYRAIVETLLAMGMQLGVMMQDRHCQFWDGELCRFLQSQSSRINKTSFSIKIPYSFSMFPRDYCCMIRDNLILFNPTCLPKRKEMPENGLFVSPYGEGGRVFCSGDVAMVCEGRLYESVSKFPNMQIWRDREIKVVMVPFPVAVGDSRVIGDGSHIDRVGCLLRGRDGGLHFILDPLNRSLAITGRKTAVVASVEETRDEFARLCGEADITLHVPREMRVPASLCLHQFEDGRVIMTTGDESVAEVVSDIVGSEKVFMTDIPIKWYPTVLAAGIRCLIGDFPLRD